MFLWLVFFMVCQYLAENNKPRLLYYFKKRGYRGFSMNRPDRKYNKLIYNRKRIRWNTKL